MKAFPIIPIWIMLIISTLLIVFTLLSKKKNYINIIIIILLFIINLRIMTPSESGKKLVNNLNVLFVVDNTVSMDALDYNGNNTRLSGVKDDCKYIIKELNGANFSLITFDNTTKIITPYTKDINTTIEAIEVMKPIDDLYAKGSSLNTPLDTLKQYMKKSKNNDRIGIIFYISDGEITDESELKSYSSLSKYFKEGAVLGYGTSKGGYMKSTNKYSTQEYIMDYSNYNYGKAISKLDEDNLKKIADDLNINYIYMDKQNKINSEIKKIKSLASNGIEDTDKSNYNDIYYIFVIPLLFLLIYDFDKVRRKMI